MKIVHPMAGPIEKIAVRVRARLTRTILSFVLFAAGVCYVPYLWCARQADEWYRGDEGVQQELAAGVADWVEKGLTRGSFNTGSSQFNGEWLFGTYLMAGLGFGQMALEHPERRPRNLALMGRCIERLLSPEVRAFDAETWRSDPLETLEGEPAHAAYLGYLNLLLSLHRLLDPGSAYAGLNDRITAALLRRIEQSPIQLIESYPGEVYPVDNCAAIGSIGLHARATGADRRAFLEKWSAFCRQRYVDPKTGLLYQCVWPAATAVSARGGRMRGLPPPGSPADAPRGSGTALGLYFLSFADRGLSAELYRGVRSHLARSVCGFGGVREYPAGYRGERGDIDSGPVVCGFGLSATGFLIGGARMHGDRAYFRRLFATAYVWGAPFAEKGRLRFVTGGPLGDSILFAMLTACPSDLRLMPEGSR